MRRHALRAIIAPLLLAIGLRAFGAEPVPAFLDSANQITVWTPGSPAKPNLMRGRFAVTVAGKQVKVVAVEGEKPITDPGKQDRDKVVLAGAFGRALGGDDWQPNGDATKMAKKAPGVFEFVCRLPGGHYEYKVAVGGSWDKNYGAGFREGGSNIALDVPAGGAIVRFVVDFNKKVILDSIRNPDLVEAPSAAPTAPNQVGASETNVFRITLARDVTASELREPITVSVDGGPARPVIARNVLDASAFRYDGEDLGSRWSAKGTTFKVWSPVATSATLVLYDSATGPATKDVSMLDAGHGVWSVRVEGDLNGKYYHYRFHSYGEERTAPDVNCYAASEDGKRSVVVDLASTSLEGGMPEAPGPWSPTDAIVYETHVRDFSLQLPDVVNPKVRGKYPGLLAGADSCGLRYLKWLGVNAIQLLPIQMFNPDHRNDYDWGYETNLFNVPESQYSLTPGDPIRTIRELKQVIAALHWQGLRVVLDVVYNHTVPSEGQGSAFWQTVPYYYFRTNARGEVLNESGVGNALDDDHPMVRKYVRDSLTYWVTEYGVDGFRFDLLGMFTPESVKDWREAVTATGRNVIFYGEPWTGGGPIRFGKGAQKGMSVGLFNDDFRNAIRGELDGPGLGFATGKGDPLLVKRAVAGGVKYSEEVFGWTQDPGESVNYASAHDNMTLWDKVAMTLPEADEETRKRVMTLMGAIVLLSQGEPFLEGGAEIGRTKAGARNSYNLGDAVNAFDWKRADEFRDLAERYRSLIALRRAHPAFRLKTGAEVVRALRFLSDDTLPPNTVAFTLNGEPSGDPWREILVVFHGSSDAGSMDLPAGDWVVGFGDSKPGVVFSGTLRLAPFSAWAFHR